jgi:hypothetical protein
VDRDEEHLKLLSIFHYVVAALMGTCASIPIIHIVIGAVFVFNPQAMGPTGAHPPPAFVGWIFMAIGTIAVALGWAVAICVFLAGRFLARRKHYTYCLVMAAIACLFMPFGTALGIFTIIVLLRPSVKPLIDQPAGSCCVTQ